MLNFPAAEYEALPPGQQIASLQGLPREEVKQVCIVAVLTPFVRDTEF